MNTDTDLHSNDLTQLSSREQLSALMDGALPADQTRFLLRRLQHDASLAECWGRWRIAGEAMRGLAPSRRLPDDFASRVAVALHGIDAVPVAAAAAGGTGARTPAWLRWGGGVAMAASLAMVALVVRQPDPAPAATVPGSQLAAAPPASDAGPAPQPQPIQPPLSQAPPLQAPASADAAPALVAAAAVAAARPLRERATARAAQASESQAGLRRQVPLQIAAQPVEPAAVELPGVVPPAEIATRPWPRSVLPQYASGGFAVGFGGQSAPASHNPFQPSPLQAPPRLAPPASEPAMDAQTSQPAAVSDAAAGDVAEPTP